MLKTAQNSFNYFENNSLKSSPKQKIKNFIPDMEINNRNEIDRKQTFYGQYCNDIKQKHIEEEMSLPSSSLKKKSLFPPKAIQNYKTNKLIDSMMKISKSSDSKKS